MPYVKRLRFEFKTGCPHGKRCMQSTGTAFADHVVILASNLKVDDYFRR